jgi:hypothetical protein
VSAASSQLSCVHGSPSTQLRGVPTQASAALHVSPSVQKRPSLHGSPAVTHWAAAGATAAAAQNALAITTMSRVPTTP